MENERQSFNKVLIMILLLGGLEMNSNAYAQSSLSSNATVKISALNGLTILKVRDLNYGIVPQNSTATIAVTDAQTGKFTVVGTKTKNVITTLTPPATLTNGSNSITYTAQASFNNLADNPATATEWIPASGVKAGFRPSANTSGNIGEFYIYIYGSITVGNVPAGTYTGVFTVSVSY
ncbi:MAG: hypothetical protein V1799_13640 [bacterium]